MKKMRGTIAVLLILMLLILGIGYAVLTNTLTITGTASASPYDSNLNVVFRNYDTTTPYYEKNVAQEDELSVTQTVTDQTRTASFTVSGLTTENDTVTLYYPIENMGIVDANIAVTTNPSVTQAADYFTIEASVQDSSLSVDGITYAVVVITCTDTPVEDTVTTNNVEIEITAEAATN